MNILMLFSGQIRPIDPKLFNESLKKFIGDNSVDISLTYWEKPGFSMNHNTMKNLEVELDIEKYIEKAFLKLNVINKNRLFLDEFKKHKIQQEISTDVNFNQRTKHSVKQLFAIYKSIQLNDIDKYDVIMRCRFDSIYLGELKLNNFSENLIYNINHGNAYYPKRLYDIFFYGTPSSFKNIADAFLKLDEYINDQFDNGLDKRDACRLLYLSCIRNEVRVNDKSKRYCDVYRENDTLNSYIGRLLYYGHDLNIEKIKEIDKRVKYFIYTLYWLQTYFLSEINKLKSKTLNKIFKK